MLLEPKKKREPTRVSEMLSMAMEEKGLSKGDLKILLINQQDTDISYEHVRRLVEGQGNPSRTLMKSLSVVLGIPFKKLEDASLLDTAHKKKLDKVVLFDAGKDPSIEPMARVWKRLTEDQRETVLHLATDLARRNKTAGAI